MEQLLLWSSEIHLMHVSPKLRWSRDPVMMSVIPSHLSVPIICPVLKVNIVVPKNIGFWSPSPFLSVNMPPTSRYNHVGGIYDGNSSKCLMFGCSIKTKQLLIIFVSGRHKISLSAIGTFALALFSLRIAYPMSPPVLPFQAICIFIAKGNLLWPT